MKKLFIVLLIVGLLLVFIVPGFAAPNKNACWGQYHKCPCNRAWLQSFKEDVKENCDMNWGQVIKNVLKNDPDICVN